MTTTEVPTTQYECPSGHGPLIERVDPHPRDAAMGTWFDCDYLGGGRCFSSRLVTDARERVRLRRVKGDASWTLPPNAVFVGKGSKWASPYSGEAGESTMGRQTISDQFRTWLLHDHDQCPTSSPGWGEDGSELPDRYYFKAPGFKTCVESREARNRMLTHLPELAGKDLVCWCHEGQPCHADVLIEMANRPEGPLPVPPIVWTRLPDRGPRPGVPRSAPAPPGRELMSK